MLAEINNTKNKEETKGVSVVREQAGYLPMDGMQKMQVNDVPEKSEF